MSANSIDPSLDLRLAVGTGLDTLTSEARDDCIILGDERSQGGQRVSYSLRIIENYSDLRRYLGISAAASLKAGLGNIEGKASYSSDLDINQYSLYALAMTRVVNSQTLLRNVKLKEDARELYAKDTNKFEKRCGDGFITGFEDGGEFISVISIQNTNETAKSDISAAITGSYGIFNAKGKVDSSVLEMTKNHKQQVDVYRSGGSPDTKLPKTLADVIDSAVSFPSSVINKNNAVKISLLTRHYATLELPDVKETEQLKLASSVRSRKIEYLSKLLDDTLYMKSNVEYVLKNSSQFTDVDEQKLQKVHTELNVQIDNIYAEARRCFSEEICEEKQERNIIFSVELPLRRSISELSSKPCSEIEKHSKNSPKSGNLLSEKFMELATQYDVCAVINAKDGIIHSRGSREETPLHIAAYSSRDISVVKVLLDAGADIRTWDINGRMPLHDAIQFNENPSIVRLLISENNGELPPTGKSPEAGFFDSVPVLHLAARNNNSAIVRLLLTEYQQDINATDESGATVLHVAAENGNMNTVELLIDHQVELNARDKKGRTALHLAAKEGHVRIIRILLRNGAEVDLVDYSGNSALHYAAFRLSGRWQNDDVTLWDTISGAQYLTPNDGKILERKNKSGNTASDVLRKRPSEIYQILGLDPDEIKIDMEQLILQDNLEQIILALRFFFQETSNASLCSKSLIESILGWFPGENSSDKEILMFAKKYNIPIPNLDKKDETYNAMEKRKDEYSQNIQSVLMQHIRSVVIEYSFRFKVMIDLMKEIDSVVKQAELVRSGSNGNASTLSHQGRQENFVEGDCQFKLYRME